ncbi:MAG TPA: TRAP transporter small permease [Kiloniellales bacterium]|nr:TRAP transporter small permease [Kiloniellales bacterium]
MAGPLGDSARPADRIGRVIFAAARALSLLGGLLMVGLAAMVVASVLGRWLFLAPIPGDFELVAMGTAVAVFLFLPYCHLARGNVLVDLFLSGAPRRVQVLFDVLGALILAVIAGALAWRMVFGGVDIHHYNETTLILGLPVWLAFPFAVLGLALLCVSCLYTAVRDLLDALR